MNDITPTAEGAAAIADHAAEALRALAYATRDWLTYPGDVYTVLGSLQELAQRIPQNCQQMTAFLERELENGRVVAVQGQPFAGEPIAAVATAAHWLGQGGRLAEQLSLALSNAQVATAGLAHAGAGDRDGEEKP